MKTEVLQKKNVFVLNGTEVKASESLKLNQFIQAHKDLGFLLITLAVMGLLWRFFSAWIGRESIRLQIEPGKFTTRGEEYQELHNQVGVNSYFRMF